MPSPPNFPPPLPRDLSLPEFLNRLRLLSRDEVDSTFGISKRFLEIAACNGGGPAFVKVGRLTRYRVQDVLDWIEANRFHNTTQAERRKGGL